MTTSAYTVPDNPADPEAAALELIVRAPIAHHLVGAEEVALLNHALQELSGLLSAEGAFAGLSWADARPAARAVCFDVCLRRHAAADFLYNRARDVLAGAEARVSQVNCTSAGLVQPFVQVLCAWS